LTRLFLALAFASSAAFAQSFDHSHGIWNGLVGKHVVLAAGGKASRVRYAEFGGDRPVLKAYLDTLSAVTEMEFGRWTKHQQMAFLINAYNAFTVELILAHYPVKSIKDIGGDLFNNRWKKRFFRLLGQDFSLDQIEHGMLRKPGVYNEFRVHFAVTCASIGCPMLREEAYAADRLEPQLEEQARRFLSDRTRNRYANGRLEVSKIFDWYGADFEPLQKVFVLYAEQLADTPADRNIVAAGKAPISFLEYDWTLNDIRR